MDIRKGNRPDEALCLRNGRAITQVNPWSSLVTQFRAVRMSEILKPVAFRQRTGQGREAHGGVKRDGAFGKLCQELGRPAGQHLRESDEAVVARKRVMNVERRASA